MGVTHSMDESQVARISAALRQSAESIQGINSKFDMVDAHWQGVQSFNSGISERVEATLGSFHRLDKTLNARVGKALNTVKVATGEMTEMMGKMVLALQDFDMKREMNALPKAIIPLMIPLVILMIELAVANAYLGILLTRLPDVGDKYSSYLLANAGIVLMGLTLSLIWLVSYRCLLSWRRGAKTPAATAERVRQLSNPMYTTRTKSSNGSGNCSNLEFAEEDEEVDKGMRAVQESLSYATVEQLTIEILRRRDEELSQLGSESGARRDLRAGSHRQVNGDLVTLRKSSKGAAENWEANSGGPRQRRSRHGAGIEPEGGDSREASPQLTSATATPPQNGRSGVKVFWQGPFTPFQAHALWGAKKERSPSPPSQLREGGLDMAPPPAR